MTRRYYRFGGMEFLLSMPEDLMYERDNFLAPFRVETVRDPHVIRFERVPVLQPPAGRCISKLPNAWTYREKDRRIRYIGLTAPDWASAHTRTVRQGKEQWVQLSANVFPGKIDDGIVLEAMNGEHLVIHNQGVLFHCAFIRWQGGALLFTAPSGTGKSTQAELWKQYRDAEIINGDRAVIRISGGELLAEGIPFCGSSRYCENRSLPLKAIVYLAQAPATTIRRLRGYEAFARVWEGITVDPWDREDITLASATVEKIAGTVPVYHMPCTPDEQAVELLEMTLRKQRNL